MKKFIFFVAAIFVCIFFCSYSNLQNNKSDLTIIKFSTWGSKSETNILKDIIKDFEDDNPKIKIEFIHIPQNYFQKIHLLFASNLEPDVIFINNQYIPIYIKANLLENLTPYFQETKEVFFDSALESFTYNKEIYAIPRDISNLVIYCNKNIFQAENILFPQHLENLEELKELAQKLTNNKHFGINTEETNIYWLNFLASNGTGAISDDRKKIIINSQKSIETLNLYSDFINKYHISPSKAEIGSMTTAQMFVNQKLAMYIGGRWMVPKFRETIIFNWDVIPFPFTKNSKLYIDASGWAVAKNSKNKTEAIKFVKYLSSKSAAEKFAQSGLIIPARKDAALSKFFLDDKKAPKNNMAFIETIQNSKPTPVNENFFEINDILNDKMLLILNGKKNAKDVFDKKTIEKLEHLI